MRSGAGYVVLAGEGAGGNAAPHALIRRSATDAGQLRGLLDDERIAVAVIGPGLGRDEQAGARLDAALDAHCKLVIDADALTMLAERGFDRLNGVSALPILTPHHGEFTRLFGEGEGGKVDRAREAARRAGAIVVYKGNDTVIAAPDGRAAIAPPAPSWLASAGTGDVLTGIVAARYAQVDDAFTAACQAVWLHGEAARRAGPDLIADDLLEALPATLAACLA